MFISWCVCLVSFVSKIPLFMVSTKAFDLRHFRYVSRLLSVGIPCKLVLAGSLLSVLEGVIFEGVSVGSWHVFHLLISCVHLLVWLIELFCAHFYREMLTLWSIEPPTSFRPAVRLAVEPFSIANCVTIPNFDTSASRFLSTFPTTDKIVAASGWARGAIMIGFFRHSFNS